MAKIEAILLKLFKNVLKEVFSDMPSLGSLDDYRAIQIAKGPTKWDFAKLAAAESDQSDEDDCIFFTTTDDLTLIKSKDDDHSYILSGHCIHIKCLWEKTEIVDNPYWRSDKTGKFFIKIIICNPWLSASGHHNIYPVLLRDKCIIIYNMDINSKSLFLCPKSIKRPS